MKTFTLHGAKHLPMEITDGGLYPDVWTYKIDPNPTREEVGILIDLLPRDAHATFVGGHLMFNQTYHGERSFTPYKIHTDRRLRPQETTLSIPHP